MNSYYTEHLDEQTASVLMGLEYDPNCSYYMTTEQFGKVVITVKDNKTGEEKEIVLDDSETEVLVQEPENIFMREDTPKGYKLIFYLGIIFCGLALGAAIILALKFPA